MDYPSNSQNPNVDEEVKEREKIISGTARLRKQSVGDKLATLFFDDEFSNVKKYLMFDMIIPGIKEMILGSLEMMFFGSSRRSSRSSRSSYDRRGSVVDYGSYSRGRREERRPEAHYEKEQITMDDIDFDTRADAQKVLDELRRDIDMYREATLAAYYQYSGVTNNDFTANDRGWKDLDMPITPRRVRGGRYILDLPRPQILN